MLYSNYSLIKIQEGHWYSPLHSLYINFVCTVRRSLSEPHKLCLPAVTTAPNVRKYRQYKTTNNSRSGHEILTWKTLLRKNEKIMGISQQIFTISGEVTNVGDLQLFLSQDDGLHEVYIGRKNPTPSSISYTELIDGVVPLNANGPLCFGPSLNLDHSSTSTNTITELLIPCIPWSRVMDFIHVERFCMPLDWPKPC